MVYSLFNRTARNAIDILVIAQCCFHCQGQRQLNINFLLRPVNGTVQVMWLRLWGETNSCYWKQRSATLAVIFNISSLFHIGGRAKNSIFGRLMHNDTMDRVNQLINTVFPLKLHCLCFVFDVYINRFWPNTSASSLCCCIYLVSVRTDD